ncbi:hypothetical protein PNEG_02377 [Pneumocystis murina B123]|uniref:Mitochondrial intermediate peptidase n=1 Tax=Pneumocystis murina (strain B123) TaxID=1069680 RepID=M7NQQ4_PNEMU|nr:hypothetical protein PNEG_02377 [Pneumocystis murina B123]EMR09436.1 hypothetical protein PNEG_02377 [Pneumocystis murina B123]
MHRFIGPPMMRVNACFTVRCVSRSLTSLVTPVSELQAVFDRVKPGQSVQCSSLVENKGGLFRNTGLIVSNDLVFLARDAVENAQLLSDDITQRQVQNVEDARRIIKDLDRLSDRLCRVIDLSELLRTVHPDKEFVAAAEETYHYMYDFMNILNTHTGLYKVLTRIIENGNIVKELTEEERVVAKGFHHDFEKSGINLSNEKRKNFVDISSRIALLGRHFFSHYSLKQDYIDIPSYLLNDLPSEVLSMLKRGDGSNLKFPTSGWIYQMGMTLIPDQNVRKRLYISGQESKKSKILNLENLLRERAELAQLVGMESYAELALLDKMMKNQMFVLEFLECLAKNNMPIAKKELEPLLISKRIHLFDSNISFLNAWDKDFYLNLEKKYSTFFEKDSIMSYFSIGTVIQGLSTLFTKLYGLWFVQSEVYPGEIWHPSVRKLDVFSEEGHIGVIYCDLFSRPGKQSGAAHYTVRCSRRIDDDVLVKGETSFEYYNNPVLKSYGKLYQLPIIVLVCDFGQVVDKGPTLLSFSELETLFHEMGHALHSMLGRTDFHNVSGTRCATDFVEFPSVLMEHFASDISITPAFARHAADNSFLSPEYFSSYIKNHFKMQTVETHSQIIMAFLDQQYHTSAPLDKGFDSTKVLHSLQDKWGLFPSVPGTSWQTQFTHLFGYGATYYSYLFDRAIAAKVWKDIFAKNPTSRIAGEKYYKEVLKWGGSRNPWECLASLLNDETLANGGLDAVRKVGHWVFDK